MHSLNSMRSMWKWFGSRGNSTVFSVHSIYHRAFTHHQHQHHHHMCSVFVLYKLRFSALTNQATQTIDGNQTSLGGKIVFPDSVHLLRGQSRESMGRHKHVFFGECLQYESQLLRMWMNISSGALVEQSSQSRHH